MTTKMTKVKNLNGTADNKPRNGCSTWKEFWETKTERKFGTCSCNGCLSRAEVGAHVQKVDPNDKKWYIVSLCNSCNNSKNGEVFEVRDYDLVAANS